MSKNKFVWVSALVLLISVPAAFAQDSFSGNPWLFLAVNSVIIWIILFALQSVMMPNKPEKEKVFVWIVSFVLSIILAWAFVGGSGFIWQVGLFAPLFNLKVLVNTVLIAGIGYFSLGLLGMKLESKQAKIGSAVLVILVSFMIAYRIEGFLWESQSWVTLYNYLLGPDGLLRPDNQKLWVFGSFAVLLSWFFIGYLKLGGEGAPAGGAAGGGVNNKLSIALGIILAASIANNGVSTDMAIKVGEIIFILMIGRQLSSSGSVPGGWVASHVVAAFLVFWASYSIFGIRSSFGFYYQNLVPGLTPSFDNAWKAVLNLVVFIIVYRILRRKAPAPGPAAGGGGP